MRALESVLSWHWRAVLASGLPEAPDYWHRSRMLRATVDMSTKRKERGTRALNPNRTQLLGLLFD